ncbi:MAG: YdiU family protein [Enhygromyxa sp.]
MNLADLPFDNSFVRSLPGDPEPDNFRRKVYGACYSRVAPTPVSAPQLLAWSPELARLVGLPEQPDAAAAAELAELFAGNRTLPGMEPYAACYGGHQFGNWAEQLGDGRAITLGEVHATPTGERLELQLKGAGPTPYSRMADGRAVLRSSIREFLCSEAMHHLGVPTTRALSLVTTGEQVIRDMFYDGNPRPEPGAIVCRVAPSFLRFGNFELLAARHEHELLARLTDYAITTHFPELVDGDEFGPKTYARYFSEVARRTAVMVAHWMRVGFVHGVMNTDNMSVLGLTIDYGPYGWIDDYDPDWTPNTTDAATRRYRFGNQPRIAAWNLVKLANALHPLVGEAGPLEDGMRVYAEALERESRASFAAKLGLASLADELGVELLNGCLRVLEAAPTDMTIFYRALAEVPMRPDASDEELLAPLRPASYVDALPPAAEAQTLAWLRRLGERVRAEDRDPGQRRAQMHAANPKYVLRNYLAQEAITAAEQGDPTLIHELLEVMRQPYAEQPGRERFAARRPEWARHRPGCSMLSCSS